MGSLVDYAVGTGGLVKKGMDLLKRPDIDKHLLKPAKRYRHLSRIRTLDKEFVPWTPLEQERMSIEEHSLRKSYTVSFLAAFDPAKDGSLFNADGQAVIDDGGRPTGL